ncbi:hypothetical protein BN11_140004 [Nostocoides australiense Ben110]|uniref:Uncharacterized protein n=1 Tax=Nostocoides australiense Ben110 TaxID=1193182 RepID=W6JUE3_9MICO|nr:hypothetical protein BN11_140004 [Tetrasphaera australiensis Ben110]
MRGGRRGVARAALAQLAEQPPCKRQVAGSIPAGGSGGDAKRAPGRCPGAIRALSSAS